MSKTLTINGTATMDTAKWDIHFDNFVVGEPEGSARLVKAPTVQQNGTYIGDFEVVLTRPGDSVKFTFDVKNFGDIDAKYTDLLVIGTEEGQTIKTSYFDNSTMNKLLKSIYIEADWDGDGETTDTERQKCVNSGLVIGVGGFPLTSKDEILKPGESKSAFIDVMFSSSATELPKGEIKLSGSLELLFEQA